MNTVVVGRVVACALLGLLAGIAFHFHRAKWKDLTREGFLEYQGKRYEKLTKAKYGLGIELVTCVCLVVVFAAVYDLLALGISMLIHS